MAAILQTTLHIHFVEGNSYKLLYISLESVPTVSIDNKSALVKIMASYHAGNKALFKLI